VAFDATIVELFEPQKFVMAGEKSATAGEKFSLPNLALTQIQLMFRRLHTTSEARVVRPPAARQATPVAAIDRRRKWEGPELGRSK
jgi:hypothetical protein